MKAFLIRFAGDGSGVTAIEYDLIAAIVGLSIIVGLITLSDGLSTLFGNAATNLGR